MVDWQSPEEIDFDVASFTHFMHVLLGLYIWEWFTSLDFDWDYITRKRQLRWPLIFYFLNRYCLLFSLIGVITAVNLRRPVNCKALFTYFQVFGNASIGFASINLSLRTHVHSLYVVAPLGILILGHWSLLLHGILLEAAWIPPYGCIITNSNHKILAANFIYAMSFDFIVLVLMVWRLGISTPGSLGFKTNRLTLTTLIFSDGLIYFVVSFLGNLIATTFILLNLNAVMSIIATVPAAIASSIVACRVVRRLVMFSTENQTDFLGVTFVSNIAFRDGTAGTHVNLPLPLVRNDRSESLLSTRDVDTSVSSAIGDCQAEYRAKPS
ncbi:hypothetical protein CYLTODRAFT_453465 [Cylindrobasidium torrendii FP15055 ss-10]|uniref:Transmembrane protein n=1 Tax=Cylindrobasidium torrendii FP15055 ss-10 TaxID=1314674 RepID=A0A0D7BE81_9AGAR|nr:hypothetical protein CYLTODRAFT_453465 [Cylindrobasidium torrendii FP15055 ss-10]